MLAGRLAGAQELTDPVPVLVGGKPLDVERVGHAAPFVGDADGDGVKDLLVGEFYRGQLRVYKNVGTNGQPRFESYTLLRDGDESGCVHAS
ncbi:MAG: hypothetical protein WEH44_09160, partial [Pirellulaceae bacterium]